MLSKDKVERIEDKMIQLYGLIEVVIRDTYGTLWDKEVWHKDLETVKFFVLHAPTTDKDSMEVCNRLWLKYKKIVGPEMVKDILKQDHTHLHSYLKTHTL